MTLSTYMGRALIWSGFGYLYLRGVELVINMAADAENQGMYAGLFAYALLFNALVAHLITKYEQQFPVLCAAVVALFAGLTGFNISATLGSISLSVMLMLFSSLVLLTSGMGFLKVKLTPRLA